VGNLTHILQGRFDRTTKSPIDQITDAMHESAMTPPPEIIMDGKIHRFGKKKTCWYVFYEGGITVAGKFGDWKQGQEVSFRADIGRPLTAVESLRSAKMIEDARKKAEEEREVKREVAATAVQDIWDCCQYATDDHPYLVEKGVKSHGIKVTDDGRLVVPVKGQNGLLSLQYIDEQGGKMFHSGGKAEGGFFYLTGDYSTETLYIAEGYATAATIYEATGKSCIVAFNASNIPRVCALFAGKGGVVVADNDEHGVGEKYANNAIKYGFRVVLPPLGMDANDYVQSGGDLMALLNDGQEVDDVNWLQSGEELSGQPAPIKWLIKGWVQDESLIMVHGPSGCGKSFLVLDWCLRIATEKGEWMGARVSGGDVVYLAGEGHHGFRSRLAAWKKENGGTFNNFYMSRSGCDLNKPEGLQRVYDALQKLERPPRIVVVDTLHRFMSGDENSAQDAKTMLDASNAIMRDFGCTVILVHHTGVNEEAQHRARGSSAWRGALDIEVSVVGAKGDKPMEIIQRKAKDSEMAETVYARLESREIDGWYDEDGEAVKSLVMVESEAPEKSAGKHRAARGIFDSMWHESGRELLNGRPFVSNSFSQLCFEKIGHSPATAKKYALGTQNKGPFAKLKEIGKLSKDTSGWYILDTAWLLALKGGELKGTKGNFSKSSLVANSPKKGTKRNPPL
jgi:putative DNA primase/helicase